MSRKSNHAGLLSQLPFDLICPCCSGKTYQHCCYRSHLDCHNTDTSEQLMRARFSAFSLASKYSFMDTFSQEYLLKSWHEDTRPSNLTLDLTINWKQLVIKGRKDGKKRHSTGKVHFIASYESPQQTGKLEELSLFKRNAKGCWVYFDGTIL